MSQETTKKPLDVEKAKEVAKSPKGKIGAGVAVVAVLAIAVTLVLLLNKTDSPDDYEYTSTTTDVTITGLKNKSLESLSIPEEITGVPVTKIAANAFDGCTAITSVKLPDTVTEIGNTAFNACKSMKKIQTLSLYLQKFEQRVYFIWIILLKGLMQCRLRSAG